MKLLLLHEDKKSLIKKKRTLSEIINGACWLRLLDFLRSNSIIQFSIGISMITLQNIEK